VAGEDRPTRLTSERLTSLDVFRGLVVALLVLVEWVPPSPGLSWLRHSPWDGVRIADVVFPAFLFMVGAGMSLASGTRWARLARRTVLLLLIGLLFNAWGDTGANLSSLRLPGVLQMIAVAGLVAGVVTAFVHRPAIVAGIGFSLVVVHGFLLSHAPLGCGTGRLDPGCSFPWAADRRLFGASHVYHQGALGHDPEGLVTTLLAAPALVLVGWAAGRFLYTERHRLGAALLAVAALASTGVAALLWAPNKRLWTPTFGLLMAAGCTLVLLALSLFLDQPARRRVQPVRWTLTALGRNALLVYVGQHVVAQALANTPSGDGTLQTALLDHVGSLLGVALLAVAVSTAIAAILHALDWHWTV
jgi:heparan-alpha-glucosaminide N-acetyltransferase